MRKVTSTHRSKAETASVVRERSGALSVTATEAKNEFGRIFEAAMQGRAVIITKHDAPKAVLISKADYDSLTRNTGTELDVLSDEFDALFARMQVPKAAAGMKAAFGASPKALGRAAASAVRRRG